jgi:ABC-type Fe3+-hydroxamate transport system substrate-binding protein
LDKMKNLRRTLIVIAFVLVWAKVYSQSPRRIVSLAPSLTNMLYLLEEKNELIGCTSYCEQAKKDGKEVVATAVEVNVEKVFLMKPDLVITTTLTKRTTIESLEKLGIKVCSFTYPASYNGICKQLMEIAELTGKQALAKRIVEKQQARLNLIKQQVRKGKKPKIFFEIGAKPLFTVVPNTFMDDYITYAGGENIAADLKSGSITRESVLLRNPDVIIIVTMGVVGAEEKTTWSNYTNISAAKSGKIFVIDSDKACSPNPVTFIDTLEQLMTMLYK